MKSCLLWVVVWVVGASFVSRARAQETSVASFAYKVDASATFGIHKEQIKNRSGEASGAIFNASFFALGLSGTRSLASFLDGGAFLVAEQGSRAFSPYIGTDAAGRPKTGAQSGASYRSLWIGPMVRLGWKPFFLDVGYVLIGLRWDSFYSTLASTAGDSVSPFQSHFGKAWLFGLGGHIPISESVHATLRIEYRYHYYGGRGGDELAQELLLGTQAIRPHLGVRVFL